MSLIDDALRRIHDPTVKRTQSAGNVPPASAPGASAPPASAHSWPTTPPSPTIPPFAAKYPTHQPLALTATTSAILGLSIALLVGGAVWLRRSPAPATSSSTAEEIAAPLASNADTIHTSPAGQAPRGTAFVLTGVVEGSGEPYAVINGAILSVGEKIADATLIEIGHGAVRLRHTDGRETILRAAR